MRMIGPCWAGKTNTVDAAKGSNSGQESFNAANMIHEGNEQRQAVTSAGSNAGSAVVTVPDR